MERIKICKILRFATWAGIGFSLFNFMQSIEYPILMPFALIAILFGFWVDFQIWKGIKRMK